MAVNVLCWGRVLPLVVGARWLPHHPDTVSVTLFNCRQHRLPGMDGPKEGRLVMYVSMNTVPHAVAWGAGGGGESGRGLCKGLGPRSLRYYYLSSSHCWGPQTVVMTLPSFTIVV